MGVVGANVTAQGIQEFMAFMHSMRERLKSQLVSEDTADVQKIREVVEEHYINDQGKPAIYQRFESVLYDDAPRIITLWGMFSEYSTEQLQQFRRLVKLELQGLTGDRHPRKVFDRSPFGVAALIVGAITVWMSFLRTMTGKDDMSDLLLLVQFNWVEGAIWIVGLFVVLWYILKVSRNDRQVAFLASLSRALDLYLREQADTLESEV